MTQMVQMTTEQLQQLIDAVRVPPTDNAANKSKSSIGNCTSRFGGQRNHEAVEEFITTIVTYKEIEGITDEDAYKGMSLLFYGIASTWWQGVRKEAKNWNEAICLIRQYFSPTKPSHQIYMEIFEQKQQDGTAIDTFVYEKRALLAQLPEYRHDEKTELNLIYGLLHIKYRKHIPRHDISSFRELLEKCRIIEHNNLEDEAMRQQGPAPVAKHTKRTYCNFREDTDDTYRKRS